MRRNRLILAALASLILSAGQALGQSPEQPQPPIVAMTLGSDQIGLIRSAPEITTRISFPEPVKEIICGDLYDSSTGKGSFVVQRSGNDVFLKPIATRGVSNLFVKTGDNGEHIYNFDLEIVTLSKAYRIVNVTGPRRPEKQETVDPLKAQVQQGAEIIANAKQSAQKIEDDARHRAAAIEAEATQRAEASERQAGERADREIERRFALAAMAGVTEIKIKEARFSAAKVAISLDRKILEFGEQAYLRYTIQNGSDSDFVFSSVTIKRAGASEQAIETKEVRTSDKNMVRAGESMSGVLIFDRKLVTAGESLSVLVQAPDNSEITRLVIAR